MLMDIHSYEAQLEILNVLKAHAASQPDPKRAKYVLSG
jgi:hypothetical protein